MKRQGNGSHERAGHAGSRGELRPNAPPSEAGARRRGERQRHRQELLEATERLLGVRSLAGLTVHDIAAESKFSVGYVYKLFDGKEEIIATLMREKLRLFRAVIRDSAAGPGAWDERTLRFVTAISSWLDRTPAYRSEVTLHLKAFARTHPGVAADFAAFLEFYSNATESLFLDAVRSGRLREEQPGEIARTFRALVAGFMEETLMHHDNEGTLADQAQLIVRVLNRAFSCEGGDL